MSNLKKATIAYIPGVEDVSRKFTLRRNTCTPKTYESGNKVDGHTYLGGMVRTKNLLGVGQVKTNFVFMRFPMAKPVPNSAQLDVRAAFSATAKWVADAMKDLSTIQANIEKINQAKEHRLHIGGASVYGNTFRGVFWDYCYDYYLSNSEAPATYALPNPA